MLFNEAGFCPEWKVFKSRYYAVQARKMLIESDHFGEFDIIVERVSVPEESFVGYGLFLQSRLDFDEFAEFS